MINTNEKKELSTLSRSEIIHNNFFNELKKQGITNAQYAKDNNLDKTVLSKWKNMTTIMSTEQVYQAAEYLHITVNNLFYSTAEKKEIMVLNNDSDYIPIKAQQTVEIKMYEESFKHPFDLLGLILFVFVLFTSISFFASKSSGFWMFLLIGIPMGGYTYYKEQFGHKQTYIVDYLDDIYYKIDKPKNQYFIINLILHIVSLLSVITSFVFLLQRVYPTEDNLVTMIIFLLLGMAVYAIVNFFTLFTHQLYLKEEIYDNEIMPHTSSMVNLYISLLLLAIGICFLYQYFVYYWYVVAFLFLSSGFSLIKYLLLSKKYSEYKLVYKEHDKEIQELFPN
ncbi:MAG: hypothetical protein RSD69_01165 [Bacilli bacterium]